MKKSAIITLAMSASLLSACSNTSASSSKTKQVLNWFSAGEISTMDPALNNDVYGGEHLDATMEGLVRLGNNSKILPGIAKSWKESKDGMTWTFNLRKNAKWSNGEALTAKDFVYAWRRQVNPKTASTQSNKYSGIKNADAIVASKKPVSSLGIKAVGKYKLVVTLERKIPYFQLLLAGSAFAPQKQKFIEKAGKKYGAAAKYTLSDGPFVMKGWTGSNLTWKLVKNKYYWDKKNVKLTKINFSVQKSQSTSYNLYQAGKLDMTTLSASQSKSLKNQKGWQIKKSNRTQYLMYNFKTDKNLRNVNLRRAIAAAINKESLAKTLNLADIAATSLTPSGITDPVSGKEFSKEVVTKETKAIQSGTKAQAKAYYKKALKELGKKQITINLLGDDTDDAKKVTEFIQSALESNLGMKGEVSNVPFKTRLSRVSSLKFDVVATGWTADFSDPISFLDLLSKGNAYNYGKWQSTIYNKNISLSKTTGSTAARWKAMVAADRALIEDQGVTPLYYSNEATLVKTSVKGVVFNGAGAPYNFKEAYIK